MPVRLSGSLSVVAGLAMVLACSTTPTDSLSPSSSDVSFARSATTTDVTISSVLPSESPQGTTLDVQINGTGFDKTSQATMPLHGVIDPRVHVNSTRYVKSTQVVANVTISADATPDSYDVVVATASGKKGIGTDAFAVVLQADVLAGGLGVNAVNQAGDLVGRGSNQVSCNSAPLPMLWHADGSAVTLPLGSFCGANALAINASGVILGSLSGGAPTSRGLWIPSGGSYTLQVIPPAPDGYSPVTGGALNDNNEIFGWAQGAPRLYWWSSTTGWLPVQVPVGATRCQSLNAINNPGEMAAMCVVNGVGNAYYWSSHDAAPVLLPRPNASGDVSPRAINDNGVIVGTESVRLRARYFPAGSTDGDRRRWNYRRRRLPWWGLDWVACGFLFADILSGPWHEQWREVG